MGKNEVPLQRIEFDAKICGTIAKVECQQFFKNTGKEPIEAIYVFPLPDEAAVTGCKIQIGENKTVVTELKKVEQAKRQYEEAIEGGNYAALLEQKRPNIFRMNVGGIEPGEEITATVNYIQPVPWDLSGARFRIPLVVAPRFIPGKPTGKTGGGWSEDTDEVPDASSITPVVTKERVPYYANISVKFSPGFNCTIFSPSHPEIVSGAVVEKEVVKEIKTGRILPDRDFVFTYKSTSLWPTISVHKGSFKDENFALVSIVPPINPSPEPADIVFLLDRSGSMAGPKIAGLKVIAKNTLEKLRDQEIKHHVGVIVFNNDHQVLSPLSEITNETIKKISSIQASGGTELGPALSKAHQMLQDSKKRKRYILLITDGQTGSLKHTGGRATIVACGIDTAVNDSTLKALARESGGTTEWFFPGEDFDTIVSKLVGDLSGPVLSQLKVKADNGIQVVGVNDVFYAKPATISLRSKEAVQRVYISGRNSDGKEKVYEVDLTKGETCDFCHQIWARDFLRENPEREAQENISLKYGVICNWTSFVAVLKKEVPGQKPERIEVPVMLPVGWDYEAVFGRNICYLASVRATREMIPIEVRSQISQEKPPIPVPHKASFNLASSQIEETVIAILVAVTKGKRTEAKKAWDNKIACLTSQEVKSWNEEKRAKVYYFVVKLRLYGFFLSDKVMGALSVRPKLDTVAMAWYILASKEGGRFVGVKKYQLPRNVNERKYMEWKLGVGKRPVKGPWKNVL